MFFIELIKFLIYSAIIVLISKYILVKKIRNLAESLDLKSRTIGNIAGYATSVPELLTIGVSSFNGLIGTSIYNVLSSNIINLIQYLATIFINKNQKYVKNNAIKTDMVLVIFTIIIPIVLIMFDVTINIAIVPIFIILYILFKYVNNNAHKLYLSKEYKEIEEEEEQSKKWKRGNKSKVIGYFIYLALCGVLLFFVGDLLGNSLENLCNVFNIPEFIMGILLGFITSIPELITFFEAQKHHIKNSNEMLGVVEATNNLFTSNVLNLFIIQSIGIIIFLIMS